MTYNIQPETTVKQGEISLNGNKQMNANMSVVHSILNGSDAIVGNNVQAELEYAA